MPVTRPRTGGLTRRLTVTALGRPPVLLTCLRPNPVVLVGLSVRTLLLGVWYKRPDPGSDARFFRLLVVPCRESGGLPKPLLTVGGLVTPSVKERVAEAATAASVAPTRGSDGQGDVIEEAVSFDADTCPYPRRAHKSG